MQSAKNHKLLALFLIVVLLGTGGCWSRREIENIGIVTAAALDKAPGSGDIELTLMLIKPSALAGGQNGGGGAGGEEPSVQVSASGKTVAEAARNITKTLSRKIFWSHNRLILIGEDLAKAGVAELDFFSRERQARLTNWIMVTGGRAAELLQVQPTIEKTTAERLANMNRTGITLEVKLFEFLAMLSSKGINPVVLPRVEKAGSNGQKFRLNGAGLFDEQLKLAGWMPEQEARGLMWLRGEDVTGGVITIPCPDKDSQFLSVTVRDGERRASVQPTEDGVKVRVHLLTDVDLQEIDCPTKLGDPEFVKAIEAGIAREIVQRGQQAVRTAKEMQVDPFGFGKVVRAQQPGYWQQVKERWNKEIFPQVPVEISADVNLRRTGLTANSLKQQ